MDFTHRTEILKGRSKDRKFRALTSDGKPCLLRLSVLATPPRKAYEFKLFKDLHAAGIPLPRPLAWGVDEGLCYHAEEWIDGELLEDILPRLAPAKQAAYGRAAGAALRRIHARPVPVLLEDWNGKFHRCLQKLFENYKDCPVRYPDDTVIFRSLQEDLSVMIDRPQTLRHGDYHACNMLVDGAGQLRVIDFHRWDYGDPAADFRRINRDAAPAPAFAAGLVDGYFAGSVPERFWRALRFYVAADLLFALPWAVNYGGDAVQRALREGANTLALYADFTFLVPSWYVQ